MDTYINNNLNNNTDTLEYNTNNLLDVISTECNKIYDLSDEVNNILNGSSIEHSELLDKIKEEFNQLIYMTNEVINMLQGIIFNSSSNDNNMIMIVIKDKIEEAKNEVISINNETGYVINMSYEQLIYDNELYNFCMFLSAKISNAKNMITDIIELEENNINILTNSEQVSLNLLKDIIEQQFDKLVVINEKLFNIINEEIKKIDDNGSEEKKDYETAVIDTMNELLEKKKSSEEIINNIYNLYSEYHNTNSNDIEDDIVESNINPKEKEEDTKEYKKYYSILNKSFWEARQYVSSKKIKYPSASYEKKVKEYQNEYLINNYNVSLEEAENFIQEYEEKYASDIYIDSIYSKAISLLKEETTDSIDELCDESAGLSKLDRKVFDILNNDLMDTIRELRIAKMEENLDDFKDISEYRKFYKISKLIDKKDMINHHLEVIQNRANKLEKLG